MNARFVFSVFFALGLTCAGATRAADGELTLKQQILMPGPLAEAHAKYETECGNCHTSFAKQEMTGRCLDCHEDIAADREEKKGFHGQSPLAAGNSCTSCHTDHEGRDADIVGLLPDSFNHHHTRFVLEGAHQSLACNSCHRAGEKFREAGSACVDCHRERDVHAGKLGRECATCHQPTSWTQLLAFDHDKTDFPLKDRHSDLSCNSCHIGQQFQFSDTRCVSCHKAADVHAGANGEQCENCHQVSGWKNLTFNHDQTDFPLHGRHADIPCRACHASDIDRDRTPTTCNACHAGADIHLGRNGERCETCHNTIAWSETIFDHNRDTDFPLSGHHTEVGCTQCHGGAIHDPLPRDCASCHVADDVHRDPNMGLCGTCHVTRGWNIISRFDHDFTSLPLIGMHQIVPCQSCHVGNQFASIDNRCVACHAGDDIHQGALGTACHQCHTPNGWDLWQFDHARDTGYALEGKHKNLSCDSCHRPGSSPGGTSAQCGHCHRAQDIHNGEFGNQCGRCHGMDNFFELLFRDLDSL